jgi:hypothetical protein
MNKVLDILKHSVNLRDGVTKRAKVLFVVSFVLLPFIVLLPFLVRSTDQLFVGYVSTQISGCRALGYINENIVDQCVGWEEPRVMLFVTALCTLVVVALSLYIVRHYLTYVRDGAKNFIVSLAIVQGLSVVITGLVYRVLRGVSQAEIVPANMTVNGWQVNVDPLVGFGLSPIAVAYISILYLMASLICWLLFVNIPEQIVSRKNRAIFQ